MILRHDAEQAPVREDGGFDRRIIGFGYRCHASALAEKQVVADVLLGEVVAVEYPRRATVLDPLHGLRHELQADAGRGTKPKDGLVAARYRPDRLREAVELAKDPIHLSEDKGRFFGRHEPARDTLEERGADFVLETPDRHAEARLRDIQLSRRSAQRAGGHDGAENVNLSFRELSGHQERKSVV